MARKRGALDAPILDAAADLFLAEGYAGTHMTHVAEAAGVSLATLYRYFESKDELLDRAFRREVARIEDPWQAATVVEGPGDRPLVHYTLIIRGHALDWATSDRALGLLLTMAETPGLLYRFFLDKVEVYEHWIDRAVGPLLPDRRFVTAHGVVAASGFYSLMIRWARGRLKRGQPDLPRHVPDSLPDAGREYHVPRACDFTAEELADWYTRMRLRAYEFPAEAVEDLMTRARALDWSLPTAAVDPVDGGDAGDAGDGRDAGDGSDAAVGGDAGDGEAASQDPAAPPRAATA